jgi:hypothetical protein
MSVVADREPLFHEVYDSEHVPALRRVPGVLDIWRFRRVEPPAPYFVAVYALANPDVPESEPWLRARDLGRWPTEVRPYTSGLRRGVYTWRAGLPSSQLADVGAFEALVLAELAPDRSGDNDPEARIDEGLRRFSTRTEVQAVARYAGTEDGRRLVVVGLGVAPTAELAGLVEPLVGRGGAGTGIAVAWQELYLPIRVAVPGDLPTDAR